MNALPPWAGTLPVLDTAPLFRPLLRELLGLLKDRSVADWERPTLAGSWKVRDIAAHLLDGDLRKVAAYRDRHLAPSDQAIRDDQDLGRFINSLNATGVSYAARLSPRLLADLLEITGGWVAGLLEGLPKNEVSLFAVSWAGERESLNWMDTAREYTERWHHQMQIRDALGVPRLLSPDWMQPLIEASLRALPRAYARVDAAQGSTVTLKTIGETPGLWSLLRETGGWRVVRGGPTEPAAMITLESDDFWRVFYNATRTPGLVDRIRIEGDRPLAAPLLEARSVIL